MRALTLWQKQLPRWALLKKGQPATVTPAWYSRARPAQMVLRGRAGSTKLSM